MQAYHRSELRDLKLRAYGTYGIWVKCTHSLEFDQASRALSQEQPDSSEYNWLLDDHDM